MEALYCSVIKSPVGTITIFADDEYITEITFSDKDNKGMEANQWTAAAALQLLQYFEGTLQHFIFPVKQSGTEFQQQVWQSLLNIPYAETISYAKFSASAPLAIRAMAAANGKNKLAIVIPCHRVIGSDGKLVGYAGGLWRKKWLLQHEREIAQKGQTELKF
ncbi:methylated-DNA--[protein]-cysteine S-methyltransferase [Pedobacter metabolipauper]|uniref:methylated-DNA--[protein]-cysteine S-methyltransferase n=1 Tax=Pedobacter metabolipauper TaxID=425513 RepID=A0A4R6SVZ1_9SPHI|nr:methylated-DNA--[protein]-cysteine S-methyltransferase [Pedobacter metabolipauper]TDQ08541.1 methylated-DNA-[protein]-cysteine S-methyltransferase [Pedobacter metabolipauper]